MNVSALQSDIHTLTDCADGSVTDQTMTVLAIVGAALSLISEAMPFTKRVQAHGIVHAIWVTVCESGCMKRQRDPTSPPPAVPVVVVEQGSSVR